MKLYIDWFKRDVAICDDWIRIFSITQDSFNNPIAAFFFIFTEDTTTTAIRLIWLREFRSLIKLSAGKFSHLHGEREGTAVAYT